MREILFRGKRSDNGIWIYGSLFRSVNEYFILPLPIIPPRIEVNPETVGQFIGLTDKNGKQIFEGDILSEQGSLFLVVWDKKWARFKLQHIDRAIQYPEWNRGEQMEVVGNINDNPELLGGDGSE